MFFRAPGTRRIGSALDKEWRATGREDELWAQVESWMELGSIPSSWHHNEPGTNFQALGPPRSTVRLYYARHAGQYVLLHAQSGKSGKGKLAQHTKTLVEQRLQQWKEWFLYGADVDSTNECLVARPKK